ncbi:MAG: polyprenyl synthetase family protein, partial [Candidatus Aenigmatarchaeota archaeon]
PQLDIDYYIAKTREHVESFLRTYLRSSPDLKFGMDNKEVLDAAEYTLLASGHRWRPILSLALAQEYGNDHHDLLPLSCAIEFHHTASLIFDDLPCMDNATLRRGQQACHLKYGENVAQLTALYLIAKGDGILSYYHDLCKRASDMKTGMIFAQHSDLTKKTRSIQDVLQIIDGKSVGPYTFAVHVGVRSADGNLIGGWNDQDVSELGRNIGRAYQIADDLADCVSSPEEVGKNVGQDERKVTSVSLLGLDKARRKATKYKQEAMRMVGEKGLLPDLLNRIVVIQ